MPTVPSRETGSSGSPDRAGRLLRAARVSRGLTLAEAGVLCGYSASTLSRLERGRQPLRDVAVLRRLCAALDIPVEWFGLTPDTGAESPSQSVRASKVGASSGREDCEDPMHRRQLLAGLAGVTGAAVLGSSTASYAATSPATLVEPLQDVLLGHGSVPDGPHDAATVEGMLAGVRADMAACRYRELARRLPAVIVTAQRHRDSSSGHVGDHANALLAAAYTEATHLLVKLHENGTAWSTADRARTAARASGDALVEAEATRMAALVLRRTGHGPKAVTLLTTTASRFETDTGQTNREGVAPADRARAFASLLSTASYSSAIVGDRDMALTLLVQADHALVAPTLEHRQGLLSYQVSVARVLGDYGAAIDYARQFQATSRPSLERMARLYEDVARALYGWGKTSAAYAALRAAEREAPQEVWYRPWARRLTEDLLRSREAPRLPGLRDFADRIGVLA